MYDFLVYCRFTFPASKRREVPADDAKQKYDESKLLVQRGFRDMQANDIAEYVREVDLLFSDRPIPSPRWADLKDLINEHGEEGTEVQDPVLEFSTSDDLVFAADPAAPRCQLACCADRGPDDRVDWNQRFCIGSVFIFSYYRCFVVIFPVLYRYK